MSTQRPRTIEEVQSARCLIRGLDRDFEDLKKAIELNRAQRRFLEEEFLAPGFPQRQSAKQQVQKRTAQKFNSTSSTAAVGPSLDHEKIALDVVKQLAPEFTTDDFLARCLKQYPGRDHEFTRLKVRKRLRRLSGFDDAPISVISKGAGRKPTRFKVN